MIILFLVLAKQNKISNMAVTVNNGIYANIPQTLTTDLYR